jgi:hypothetical protein
VERYVRSFTFLHLTDAAHPAVLIVHDRVRAAQPSFAKTWLFHGLDRPRLDDGGFTVTGLHGGALDGAVLLPVPAGRRIEAIGGPGHEFHADGRNWPQTPRKGTLDEVENAGWRIELTATAAQQDATFLVAMQMRDGTAAPLPVTTVTGDGWIGVRIADRLVIVPDRDEWLAGPLTFAVAGTEPVHVLVTGAAPGAWVAQHAGGVARPTATGMAHVIDLCVPPGAVRLAH